ncbi:hypothetical protein [Romboutsia sp. 1001713B170207_170306_H8]|uniref:hypothetical protein n=1 Tax=Romboutsia sp. 1001713B170207_170306_H8 TaxID=2787112 RepID=UPI00189815AF|nr:hypothetical protein [Romboutsia sp. 1001713B170207_170306_H8]
MLTIKVGDRIIAKGKSGTQEKMCEVKKVLKCLDSANEDDINERVYLATDLSSNTLGIVGYREVLGVVKWKK